MKMNRTLKILALAIAAACLCGCFKYAVDEDGLLISNDDGCYVLKFELYDVDQKPITSTVHPTVIDTLSCTVDYYYMYGTVLDNVYPRFNLYYNCKLDPKITGRVNWSDGEPRRWTVVSGSRRVRKTYTVYIHEEQPHI